jgi:hypothetical protein
MFTIVSSSLKAVGLPLGAMYASMCCRLTWLPKSLPPFARYVCNDFETGNSRSRQSRVIYRGADQGRLFTRLYRRYDIDSSQWLWKSWQVEKRELASSKRRYLPCLIVQFGISAHHGQAEESRPGAHGPTRSPTPSDQPVQPTPECFSRNSAKLKSYLRRGLLGLDWWFTGPGDVQQIYNYTALPINDGRTVHSHPA